MDVFTIAISLTAAFVLGAIFTRVALKVFKVAILVTLTVLVIGQITLHRDKLCALAHKASPHTSIPFCQ
ncbi:MAG: hypothetical protein H6617_06150 [Bdellovibrionaceae bacterium]|nr:hypothetical protein [Pseudobdellovibrionaceae bacterium]